MTEKDTPDPFNKSRLNDFLESFPFAAGLFVGNLVYSNSKFLELFDGANSLKNILLSVSGISESFLDEKLAMGESFEFEGWDHNREKFFQITVTPEIITGGNLCVFFNQTEFRKIQDFHEKLILKLHETQRLESIGLLAGGIAHDFNNMLMGVLGNIGLALMELPATSPGIEYLRQIETAAIRLAELTNQLMAYSGKSLFVISNIDVNSLIKEMINLMETGRPPGVTVNYDLCPSLPNISGDASQIRQVLMNIIINAFESITAPSGVISISTGLCECSEEFFMNTSGYSKMENGEYVYIRVRDTGAGISTNPIEKIFDPFFTTKFAGRGLGLASALGIVKSHRGALKVESETGKGSTFIILFPQSSENPEIQIQVEDFSIYSGKGKILVIDDEEWVRIVVRNTLRKFGYSVITAADGMEGIRLFATNQEQIRLVLLDMVMPGLSGRETFNELKLLEPDIPVLLTSGYSEDDAIRRFGHNSISGFIQKPFTPLNLAKYIKNILG